MNNSKRKRLETNNVILVIVLQKLHLLWTTSLRFTLCCLINLNTSMSHTLIIIDPHTPLFHFMFIITNEWGCEIQMLFNSYFPMHCNKIFSDVEFRGIFSKLFHM